MKVAVDPLCRLVAEALPPRGAFALFVVEDVGGDDWMTMASNAGEDATTVLRRFVAAGGKSEVPTAPPPSSQRLWAREEHPKILKALLAAAPDAGLVLFVWFGKPDGLMDLYVGGNLPREATVGLVTEALEDDAEKTGNEAGAWQGALS